MVVLNNHFLFNPYVKCMTNKKGVEMVSIYRKNKKWVLTLSLVLVLVLGTVGTVSATEFPTGDTIPAGETVDDDVFISGENVVIDGTVNGMLFATGGTVTLNGTVVGDALLIAENVVVSKSAVVDGNLFIGGAYLIMDGEVTGSVFGGSPALELGSLADIGRNLYYGGFSLITESDSRVGRDLFAGAYQAQLSGLVSRDMVVGAAAVELDGKIGRNARIEVGDVDSSDDATMWMRFNPYLSQYVQDVVQPGIHISDGVKIGGKLVYVSSVDQTTALEAVTAGHVVYQTPVPYDQTDRYPSGTVQEFNRSEPGQWLARAGLVRIGRNFIKLMALGALALWLLRKPFMQLVDAATKEPLQAIGWGFILAAMGFLGVFVVPLVFVMAGVILGFLSLGSLLYVWFGITGTALLLAFMLFFFAVFTLSKLFAAFMFGRWLMKIVFKQEDKPWLSLLLGVFLYVLIRSIPVLGWLAGLTAILIGTGAFWLVFFRKNKIEKS
jgi:hypothetical protein